MDKLLRNLKAFKSATVEESLVFMITVCKVKHSLKMLLTVHVCLLLSLHAVAAGDRNITLGLLLPVGIAGNRIMTSVEIATQTVDQRLAEGTLRGFTLSFIPRRTGTFCGPAIRLLATVHAAELHYIHNVDGFVGHFCSYQTLPVADMTFTWNLPILTGGTFFDTTVDETRYSTLTRTAYGLAVFSETLKNVLDEFNWEICTIILPQTTAYATIGSNVGEMLLSLGKIVTFRRVEPDKMDSWEEFLRSVSEKARVIIFALRGEYVREIMVTAYSLGLINGDFAFIDIEPFPNKQFFGDHNWQKGDEFDEQARIAYEALFAVRLFQSTGEEYMKYRAQMKRQLLEKYNYTEPFPNDTNFFIEAFYDAVTLYSLAVNETLAEGGDVRDGHLVVSKMWNRTFEGITGTVAINENGGRDTEVIVWDMTDTENGTFNEIFQYNQTVGQLTPFGTRAPTWPAGRTEAPADRPFCGFDNENPACQDITNGLASILYAVGSTVAVMIVLSSITMFYIYRRISLDAELKEMTWRVKWDDLFFSKFRHSTFSRSVSVMETSGGVTENTEVEKVATFQGKLVQVKNIKKAKIDLTRDVLLELRNMRLIEHGNVVRFVGACVDAPNIAVIQEHCSKGCLEDLIHNEDIKLDGMFKYSLIQDMIQGLYYIHGSAIGVHGYLTSETCYVDSRFVLKVGDYGLRIFRQGEEQEQEKNKETYRLMWRSPEAIRDKSLMFTKEADMYSAGIVTAEILTRLEPYEEERNNMIVADVIRLVREGGAEPFRQRLPGDIHPQMALLITKCWEEIPANRPTITEMASTLKKMNKKTKKRTNLLDNLLDRMELYANNLEQLVEERTEAFLEEKKKAETLLYEVLPKSVADQLKNGQAVKPEAYGSVTIFFSDIVGFTSMSAASTPMQVVAFLNDLYSCFDNIISNFDAYKVETIGDAYMCVSGLPIRNGDLHVREIANMSLVLIDACSGFKIRHHPDRKLLLRVGLHTGPCVAGVVGLKMPRYCLFGDTVNTASRMESNGEALKIHVSNSTHDIMEKLGGFQTELRGEVSMKGKGKQTTFWLLNSDSKPELQLKSPYHLDVK